MLITTQSENILRYYYNVFDTDTGLQYSLTLEKKEMENAASVDLRITLPGPILEEHITFYIEQEAIDFWSQLKRMKPEKRFTMFIDKSLNKAIKKLEQKGQNDED